MPPLAMQIGMMTYPKALNNCKQCLTQIAIEIGSAHDVSDARALASKCNGGRAVQDEERREPGRHALRAKRP